MNNIINNIFEPWIAYPLSFIIYGIFIVIIGYIGLRCFSFSLFKSYFQAKEEFLLKFKKEEKDVEKH